MRTSLLVLLAASAGLASCSSHGMGSVPHSLVELYDVADPAGTIEIELDRDGSVREMEAVVPIADLPPRVREAALARAPGGLIVGAERELQEDGWMWEVKVWHDGRDWELIVDDHGEIHETERALHRFEWPDHVMAAAHAAVPGGVVTSVEVVQKGETSVYHVKKERDGGRYKLSVGNEGTILRKVREQRAEIEIPLAD